VNKLSEISKIARNETIYYKNRQGDKQMSSNSYEVLRLAVKHPGQNLNYFSDRLNVDKALITRITSFLVKEGYIYLTNDTLDKRSRLVFPTEKGVNLKLEDEEEREAFYSYLEEFIPSDKKDDFLSVLDTLYLKSKELRHEHFAQLKKPNETHKD